MIQALTLFAKRILSFGGFKVGEIPHKAYQVLLTAFSSMLSQDVVMIEPFIKLAQSMGQGRLILDDTTNPKYGLKQWARKLKIVGTSGYEHGYKILLFLWECGGYRVPLGFALWHKETQSVNALALKGLSLLRNRFELKPEAILADGAFSTDKMLKLLEGYGWACVMRFKSNRKLGNQRVEKTIARGYGDTFGELKNGVKVKVFRRKSRFFVCNRMTWDMAKAVNLYKLRWRVEEVFRALKQTVCLKGCQQHSMQAQALYLLLCLILFTGLELHGYSAKHTQSVYQTAQAVISGQLDLQNILQERLFNLC